MGPTGALYKALGHRCGPWAPTPVFFPPVTTKSARDTPPVKFCHGQFWLFPGILSKIVTGKLKNFTVIFSKKVTGKLEISRSIRKKVVTGNLKFVTGTFVL